MQSEWTTPKWRLKIQNKIQQAVLRVLLPRDERSSSDTSRTALKLKLKFCDTFESSNVQEASPLLSLSSEFQYCSISSSLWNDNVNKIDSQNQIPSPRQPFRHD